MTAPRYVIRNCYKPTDHPIHASGDRPTMYECEDHTERVICPGGRAGDKRLRESHDIANLWALVRLENALAELPPAPAFPQEDSDGPDEPDEPDYDEEYEADRAADRYEAWLYRD